MPPHPGEPLTKVTINLYTADVEELSRTYGHGWSTHVREVIRRSLRGKPKPLTVEEWLTPRLPQEPDDGQ